MLRESRPTFPEVLAESYGHEDAVGAPESQAGDATDSADEPVPNDARIKKVSNVADSTRAFSALAAQTTTEHISKILPETPSSSSGQLQMLSASMMIGQKHPRTAST